LGRPTAQLRCSASIRAVEACAETGVDALHGRARRLIAEQALQGESGAQFDRCDDAAQCGERWNRRVLVSRWRAPARRNTELKFFDRL
jgi:hypothetical protein